MLHVDGHQMVERSGRDRAQKWELEERKKKRTKELLKALPKFG